MITFSSVCYVVLIAVLLVAEWMKGNRLPVAWLYALGSRLGLIVWSSFTGAVALAPVAAAFIVIDWRNYRKWRKERAASEKIAQAIVSGEGENL